MSDDSIKISSRHPVVNPWCIRNMRTSCGIPNQSLSLNSSKFMLRRLIPDPSFRYLEDLGSCDIPRPGLWLYSRKKQGYLLHSEISRDYPFIGWWVVATDQQWTHLVDWHRLATLSFFQSTSDIFQHDFSVSSGVYFKSTSEKMLSKYVLYMIWAWVNNAWLVVHT